MKKKLKPLFSQDSLDFNRKRDRSQCGRQNSAKSTCISTDVIKIFMSSRKDSALKKKNHIIIYYPDFILSALAECEDKGNCYSHIFTRTRESCCMHWWLYFCFKEEGSKFSSIALTWVRCLCKSSCREAGMVWF